MDLSVCTELSVTRQNKKFSVTEANEGRNMSLQEAASQVGRRATKFCPANVQKFKIGWQKEFHGKKLLNFLM